MKRPMLSILMATLLMGALAVLAGPHGTVVDLARFLAIFLALGLLLVMAFVQFWNRPWPLDPPRRWGDAGMHARSRRRARQWR